jgi:hypothetical protein
MLFTGTQNQEKPVIINQVFFYIEPRKVLKTQERNTSIEIILHRYYFTLDIPDSGRFFLRNT